MPTLHCDNSTQNIFSLHVFKEKKRKNIEKKIFKNIVFGIFCVLISETLESLIFGLSIHV